MSQYASDQDRELVDTISTFLRKYYREEIGELANEYPSERQSLWIDWQDVYTFDIGLADDLRQSPNKTLPYFDEALQQYDLPVDMEFSRANVLVENLPESNKFSVGAYRSDNIGELIAVSGQVTKRTKVRPKPKLSAFECQRCGTMTRIPQDGDELQEPHECQGCERQGPFRVDYDQSEWEDHQLLRIQQPPEETAGGQGVHVDAHVTDDLVQEVDTGDRITLNGVMALETPDQDQMSFEPYLDGKGIEIEDTDYEDIDIEEYEDEILAIAAGKHGDPFQLLVDSIAPKVEGMDQIKQALVLQLFGGTRLEYPDGERDRGNSHILLLGDPGTAKSSLLRAVEGIAPRATFASGKGASAAGMTAAAVSDDFGSQKWTLEAGALVLANQGVACVDEIDKVKEDAVSSMHEALENERVNVHKAGINADLPAQTALLAAGNPKYGRFDKYTALNEQVELGPTILSRFDLIFQIRDNVDEDTDNAIAGHILDTQHAAKRAMVDDETLTDADREQVEPELGREEMQQYIAYARTFTPLFENEDVKQMLQDEHVRLRQVNGDDDDATVPVTHRKLEGAYRLAEASAKARFSAYIQKQDVKRALRLIGRSLQDWGQNEDGELDADVTESSTSATQRDRLEVLGEVLEEMQIQYDDGVPVGELIAKVTDEANCKAKSVEHDIEKLKRKGEVVEPKTDHLRSV